MKNSILILFYFSFVLQIASQTKAERNFGSWYMYHGNHKITKNWSFNLGFQERNYKAFERYNLAIVYGGVNYKLNEKWTANLTYGYLDIDRTFDPDVIPNTIEHRIFEQLTYNTTYFKTKFWHRFRLEHRNLYTMSEHTLINRFRYRLKTKIPLVKNLYANINNESFFNFKGDFYAENRFVTAIGCQFSKSFALEIGYLNQYINRQNLNRLQVAILIKTGY